MKRRRHLSKDPNFHKIFLQGDKLKKYWLLVVIIAGIVFINIFFFKSEPIHEKAVVSSLDTEKSLDGLEIEAQQPRISSILFEAEIIYAVLKLPLEFSHSKRHENIEDLKKVLPNLVVVNGYHGNTVESRNELIRVSRDFDLYINKKYYDNSGSPVHFGKIGLYATFLRVFRDAYNHKSNIHQEDKNLFAQFEPNVLKCLVIVEDDLVVNRWALESVKPKCSDILSEAQRSHDKTIFYRLSQYNALNIYNINLLPAIHQVIREEGITNPFDIFTRKHNWFVAKSIERRYIHQLKLKSSLISQKKVAIDSWNKCLATGTEVELEKHELLEPLCDLDIHN